MSCTGGMAEEHLGSGNRHINTQQLIRTLIFGHLQRECTIVSAVQAQEILVLKKKSIESKDVTGRAPVPSV